MPAEPWFMWRWTRCTYCFISLEEWSCLSHPSGTASVNAALVWWFLLCVLPTACSVGLQIKSNHHYSGLLIHLKDEIGHPFLPPSQACLVVIVLTARRTRGENQHMCISNPVSQAEGYVKQEERNWSAAASVLHIMFFPESCSVRNTVRSINSKPPKSK